MVITLNNMADLIYAVKNQYDIMDCIKNTVRQLHHNGCEDELDMEMDAVYEGAISQDYDLEMFLEAMGWEITHSQGRSLLTGRNYVHLAEKSTGLLVELDFVDRINRHGEDLPCETFFFFANIRQLHDVIISRNKEGFKNLTGGASCH